MLSEHDFVISGGDAWVTAYKDVPMDLSTFGGPTTGPCPTPPSRSTT